MKTFGQIILCAYLALTLSGCMATAIGVGAAGGAYVEKNYDVDVDVKKK